ncbi:MAG: hypothetical protein AAFU78_22065 [Cyanobacteria bacterium J06633_2]
MELRERLRSQLLKRLELRTFADQQEGQRPIEHQFVVDGYANGRTLLRAPGADSSIPIGRLTRSGSAPIGTVVTVDEGQARPIVDIVNRPWVREPEIEEPVPEEPFLSYIGVLYRVREDDKVAFYVGGFSATPIKITEFDFFEATESFNVSLALSTGSQGGSSSGIDTYKSLDGFRSFYIESFTLSANISVSGEGNIGSGQVEFDPTGNILAGEPVSTFRLTTFSSDTKNYSVNPLPIAALSSQATASNGLTNFPTRSVEALLSSSGPATGSFSAVFTTVDLSSLEAMMTADQEFFYVTVKNKALEDPGFSDVRHFRVNPLNLQVQTLEEVSPQDWKGYIASSQIPYFDVPAPNDIVDYYATRGRNVVGTYEFIADNDAWDLDAARVGLFNSTGGIESEVQVDRVFYNPGSTPSPQVIGQSDFIPIFSIANGAGSEAIAVDDYAAIAFNASA